MLVENTMFGENDKVKKSIDRLRAFEPEEGYYLCFSGGKDSQCIYHLAKEAGVKFDAHYNITGIDPPELVYFIRRNYPNVTRHMYKRSMFMLIEAKGIPSRRSRFCCSELKEHGGEGRVCVTGVRWAESNKRKGRKPFEIVTARFEDKKLFNDNDEGRRMFENCMQKGKRVINPIIDWEEGDVWEYLNSRGIEHCKLYDEGETRIGCIGCPLNPEAAKAEMKKYPKFYDNYMRAIGRWLPKYLERCKQKDRKPYKETAKEWMNFWLGDDSDIKNIDGQLSLFEDLV